MLANRLENKSIRRLIFGISGTYIAMYGLLLITLKPGLQISDITLRGLYTLTVIVAFVACVWASRKSVSYRRLWRLMATGMFFWMSGEIIFFSYVVKYGSVANVPSPTIADIFSVAYAPIILGVLFSLGRIRAPFDNNKKQFLASVSMLALAAFLLCYEFLLIPQWYSNPSMSIVQKTYAIAYPLFDWVIITSLLLASRRFQEDHIEGWLVFLLAAFSLSIIADITFYMLGSHRNFFTTWELTATAILITMAAIDEVSGVLIGIKSHPRARSITSPDVRELSKKPWSTILIQLTASIAIPIAWLEYTYRGAKEEVPVLLVVSITILILQIYRNQLLVSANAILSAKALRDGLTGLNNHRYFQEALNKAVIRADKTKRPVSLLVLDIDDFSQINNVYGHIVGDRILTTIGTAILAKTGEDVEACRLSGDEFGIIIPETNSVEALTVAEKIKENINNAIAESFPADNISISIGLSIYPTLAKDKDMFLHTAEGAMYWVKLHGKNSILLYNPKVVKALSPEERARMAEEAALVDMVRSLARAVDARDKYTRLHSTRVSALAARLAKHAGLDDKTVSRIELAGILHDVGKIGVPDSILNKPGRLTSAEMTIIKMHPTLSADIISSTSLKEIVPTIRAHHERWDGDGYPLGLKAEAIPIEARIIAIADTFDAMVTDRPYRKGLSIEEALDEIDRCAGTQFDSDLAEQFLLMFTDTDIGSFVQSLYAGEPILPDSNTSQFNVA